MENNQINYFVWINRILTNLLSGVIASMITIATYYLFIYLLQIDVLELTNISFLLFVIIVLALFLGLFTYQLLQNYFCHLLEKDKYKELGRKVIYNFLANLGLVVTFLILGFVLLTQSLNASTWAITGLIGVSFILGHLIRDEKDLVLSFCNLIGVSIGLSISILMVITAAKQSIALAIIIGLFSLPIIAIINSSLELLGVVLKSLVSSDSETEITPDTNLS